MENVYSDTLFFFRLWLSLELFELRLTCGSHNQDIDDYLMLGIMYFYQIQMLYSGYNALKSLTPAVHFCQSSKDMNIILIKTIYSMFINHFLTQFAHYINYNIVLCLSKVAITDICFLVNVNGRLLCLMLQIIMFNSWFNNF